MSERDAPDTEGTTGQPREQATADGAGGGVPPEDARAARSVNRGALVIVSVLVASLAWYLFADRFTPYTRQARINGFVIGVAPQVAGPVAEVWIRNDEEVAEGQRLFRVDPEQYEIAVRRARTDYENAQRQVGAGSAAVEAARASLRAAQANAVKTGKDARRLERLHEEDPGAISIRRLEVAQASYAQALAQVDAAQAQIEQAIEAMGGDEDENTILKTALTALEKAQLDLDRTTVRAPSRGVVTDLRADVGRYAAAGTPVMTLIALHRVWISAEFTENNLGYVRTGTPVEIVLDAVPGTVLTGTVRSIGLGVSGGQAASPGTLPTIQNNRDWLRQAQRFPVVVDLDAGQGGAIRSHVRVGGQASVIAYTGQSPLLETLGRYFIRVMSWLSYAY